MRFMSNFIPDRRFKDGQSVFKVTLPSERVIPLPGGGGVLEVYMTGGGGGGPTELPIANPKKYTSLKF